jgi:superfamily II DNA helicase RecQ
MKSSTYALLLFITPHHYYYSLLRIIITIHHSAGTARILCATVAFGMGMDVPNIQLVLHWDAADSFVDFVQQTGRAGRNGTPCICITMYDRAACQRQQRFARKCKDCRQRDYEFASMVQVRCLDSLSAILRRNELERLRNRVMHHVCADSSMVRNNYQLQTRIHTALFQRQWGCRSTSMQHKMRLLSP